MFGISPPIQTEEIQIVDAKGDPRITLSAKDGTPVITLTGPEKGAMIASVSPQGFPSVVLQNPASKGPGAALELDDKGAHVKFDCPGGGLSYLFLNNGGGSGVVLIDTKGKRRVEVLVSADGTATITRYDSDGRPIR